jgi:DNA repair protein RadC
MDRFMKEGLDSFAEVHVLELLLFFARPRIDTKTIARDLLNRFGSYTAVMEASQEALMQVDGVGERTAMFIRLINSAGRYYQVRSENKPRFFRNIQECGSYLQSYFIGRKSETVYVLCLDAKGALLGCHLLSEGDQNSVNIPARKLVELALSTNASSIVLAHSHPSGLALPSNEDIMTTRNLSATLSSLGVVLLDHLIFAEGDWVSLAQSRLYEPPMC